MEHELTNLLPFARMELLRKNYRIRLTVAALFSVAALFVFFVVLLYPSHVRLEQNTEVASAQLARAEEKLGAASDRTLQLRLEALAKSSAALVSRNEGPSISAVVRDILALPHDRVTLTSFSYVSGSSTLELQGSSQSRDALRTYQNALQELPSVAQADLPVSAYAQEFNIPFIITLTLAP